MLTRLTLLAVLLLANAPRAQSAPSTSRPKPQKPLTVLDYFYLLPSFGIGATSTRKEKRESLRPRYRPIIDLQHDFLEVQPDSSPREQFAVFRARGQADLLAVSMPDSQTDYNFFAVYRLQNGKLQDVTRQVLPLPARINEFLYELPRIGTTIRVSRFDFTKQSRHPAFTLKWRQGHFIKTP